MESETGRRQSGRTKRTGDANYVAVSKLAPAPKKKSNDAQLAPHRLLPPVKRPWSETEYMALRAMFIKFDGHPPREDMATMARGLGSGRWLAEVDVWFMKERGEEVIETYEEVQLETSPPAQTIPDAPSTPSAPSPRSASSRRSTSSHPTPPRRKTASSKSMTSMQEQQNENKRYSLDQSLLLHAEYDKFAKRNIEMHHVDYEKLAKKIPGLTAKQIQKWFQTEQRRPHLKPKVTKVVRASQGTKSSKQEVPIRAKSQKITKAAKAAKDSGVRSRTRGGGRLELEPASSIEVMPSEVYDGAEKKKMEEQRAILSKEIYLLRGEVSNDSEDIDERIEILRAKTEELEALRNELEVKKGELAEKKDLLQSKKTEHAEVRATLKRLWPEDY